ncbi:CGNR zinc finger domain-containing protein [Streptomyces malaysiensis]|nr:MULTISPECIES: CGNR zinc finger domain-containing protein [Streptomyces]MCC4316838.1 CGNR zinc finger domain-containing protein [Streptomyces malaysiensis]MCM3812181.1 CGNR zinc finger domain-containing protein [Streptomyces sp. DR7-3]UHH22398.1 CGNR zinc finger domain-containing protein [Streptomyces sp. HNM0561]WHX16382.1 CGNR zinc finger domain-containing protein [Streptomyces sp. NA07423]
MVSVRGLNAFVKEEQGMVEGEELLLAVVNSAPVIDGRPTDALEPAEEASRWLRGLGGCGTAAEREAVRDVRDALHRLIRGTSTDLDALNAVLGQARLRPMATSEGLEWQLEAASDHELAVRVVLAWSAVRDELPGRLRPCANEECNLFLVDHSRPGTARWCSMATCGNRMKARTHARRRRTGETAPRDNPS